MARIAMLGIVATGLAACSDGGLPPGSAWPPRIGQPYADLRLVDQTGQRFSLASLKGKVVLVELIGMT